jgi:uncharacterized membrane protein YgaE (UPF0421/DUF939 family)
MDADQLQRHREANARYRAKNRDRINLDKQIAYLKNATTVREKNLIHYYQKKLVLELFKED